MMIRRTPLDESYPGMTYFPPTYYDRLMLSNDRYQTMARVPGYGQLGEEAAVMQQSSSSVDTGKLAIISTLIGFTFLVIFIARSLGEKE